MPRLLSVNSYHYRRGGSDVVYLDHDALFAQAGWDTAQFSMHHPRNEKTPHAHHFVQTVDAEFAHSLGAKVNAAWRTIYNCEARNHLETLLSEQTFDVAHLHCIYHHLTPAILPVLKRANIPIVLTAHDLKLACPAYKMMHSGGVCEACKTGAFRNVVANRCIRGSFSASLIVMIEAQLYRHLGTYRDCLDAIICPSHFYREKLIEWGWDAQKLYYIPNFITPISRDYVGDYNQPITYFGRLAPEKGLTTLIKAAALSKVPVNIIGSGPEHTRLESLIRQIDAPVHLLGRKTGAALWRAVGQAKAIILPSEWYENAPVSILEAFSLRRPVLASNIGGLPELVTPDRGLLFEPGNPNAVANALRKVDAMDVANLFSWGQCAQRYVHEIHNKGAYYSAVSNLYGQLTAHSCAVQPDVA